MEKVSLILADDHPLIQLGFRGKIRIGADFEVQIVRIAGLPDRRRRLPVRKRRALILIAAGCQPLEMAERLNMCLEHAEALHAELTQKLGLDRIAQQVRSAVRSSSLFPVQVQPTHRESTQENRWNDQDLFMKGGKAMADQDLVRTLFPDAQAQCQASGEWMIIPDPEDPHLLGHGRSEAEAWSSAAIRLCQDEWFRPILSQLVAMRSARQADA